MIGVPAYSRTTGYYTYIDTSTTVSTSSIYEWPSGYITANTISGYRNPSQDGDALERLRGMHERRAAGREVAA